MLRRSLVALALVAAAATPATAQIQRPIPRVVFDIRMFYSGLEQDPVTAEGLDVQDETLPTRGLGGYAGIHFYPWRGKSMAFGVGGEGIIARGRAQLATDEGVALAPPIEQQLRGIAPVVSLNFGHERGWSYLTAGMGPLSFITFIGEEMPADPRPFDMTINMGGGARWFAKPHLAFGFDVRFYLTKPSDGLDGYPPRQRTRLLILSAGMSFK